MAERTLYEIRRRQFGYAWLGNATLEEYAVASWLEDHHVQYQYQAFFGGFRDDLRADFLILRTAPPLILEVQGDKWHRGYEQRVLDRLRAISLEMQGAFVVEIWGHDIVGGYPGWPTPTDESFNRVMRNALGYVELSRAA